MTRGSAALAESSQLPARLQSLASNLKAGSALGSVMALYVSRCGGQRRRDVTARKGREGVAPRTEGGNEIKITLGVFPDAAVWAVMRTESPLLGTLHRAH